MGLQASQQTCPLHFSYRRQRLACEGFSKKPPHVCCSKKNFLLPLKTQNSSEKFKQLERKRLVRFCIHFGVMTMYQLHRFCSFWLRMILWLLFVKWKERYFNVSILKRYHLRLETVSFFTPIKQQIKLYIRIPAS